jgi:hypothetical protein
MADRNAERRAYLKDYPAVETALRRAEEDPAAHAELLGFLEACDYLSGEQLQQLLEIAEKIAQRSLAKDK